MKTARTVAEQIADIEAEIAAVEAAGPSLASRLAVVEADLMTALRHFQQHGFIEYGRTPDERRHYQQIALRGALMTAAGDAILASERARVERGGRGGLDAAEKRERLDGLRSRLRPLLAKREQVWRSEELAGRPADRRDFAPEFYLAHDHDLAAIAAEEVLI